MSIDLNSWLIPVNIGDGSNGISGSAAGTGSGGGGAGPARPPFKGRGKGGVKGPPPGQGGGSSPPATDPYWANVAALFPFTTDQNDVKNPSRVCTLTSGATVDTTRSKWGTKSLNLDRATSEYLLIAANTPVDMRPSGASPTFTIEMWLWIKSWPASVSMLYNNISSPSAQGIQWTFNLNGAMQTIGYTNVGGVVWSATSANGIVTTGQWYHLAICANGGNVYLYVNGVQKATSATSGTLDAGRINAYLGIDPNTAGRGVDGNVSDLRITLGVARYPNGTTFTPPTAALPTS